MSPCILVVDDLPELLELYRIIFRRVNYEVYTVTHGQTALQYAAQHPFDVILLDVMMPGLNGYEVCRQLKAEERTRHVPVILISASGDGQVLQLAQAAGATAFLRKPFSPVELLTKVKAILESAHSDRHPRSEAAMATVEFSKYGSFNIQPEDQRL